MSENIYGYRLAVNNRKCVFCGYRTLRVIRNGVGVEVSRLKTCMLRGVIIEDDHTCKYWRFEQNERIEDIQTASGNERLGDPLARMSGELN